MASKSQAVATWESLFRAQVQVMRRLAADFPTHEMSLNEYDVLFNLSLQPERAARLRDLNELVFLSQPSVSRLVDRLVARGIVIKEQDPDDRRGTIVRMTAAGFDAYRRVAAAHIDTIANVVGDRLSDDELKQLRSLTDRLYGSRPASRSHVPRPRTAVSDSR
ncbi:MarR family winged helix-turn-helix transcriptional regulator [Okibacterium endophyticum]